MMRVLLYSGVSHVDRELENDHIQNVVCCGQQVSVWEAGGSSVSCGASDFVRAHMMWSA